MRIVLLATALAAIAGPELGDARAAQPASPVAGIWAAMDESIKQVKIDGAKLEKFLGRAKKLILQTGLPAGKRIAAMTRAREADYEACLATTTVRDLASLDRVVLLDHVECLGVAQGRDKCELLQDPETGHAPSSVLANVSSCRMLISCRQMFLAVLDDQPNAEKLCRECLATGFAEELDKLPQVCQLLVKKLPPQEVCPKILELTPKSRPKQTGAMETCTYEANLYRGVPQRCADKRDDYTPLGSAARSCPSLQSFLRARQAKNPGLCGSSALCRYFMTRDPKVCGQAISGVRRQFCDKKYEMVRESEKVESLQIQQEASEQSSGPRMASESDLAALQEDLQAALAAMSTGGDPAAQQALANLLRLSQDRAAQDQKKTRRPVPLQQILMDIYVVRSRDISARIMSMQGALDGFFDKRDENYLARKSKVDDLREGLGERVKSMQDELTP